jgi:hypothetical protein
MILRQLSKDGLKRSTFAMSKELTGLFDSKRPAGWLRRLVKSRLVCFAIAAENQFGNTGEHNRAINHYGANPFPPGRSKRQKPKPISKRGNSANDEKRPREEAVNAAAARNVDQTRYPHERKRRCPQNRF